MLKHHIAVLIFLAGILMVSLMNSKSGSQEIVENQNTRTIRGTVTTIDVVGGVMNVQTEKGPMAFSISDQTKKIQDTHDIGILDIKSGDPVSIQYESISPGKNMVISIVDNKPGNMK